MLARGEPTRERGEQLRTALEIGGERRKREHRLTPRRLVERRLRRDMREDEPERHLVRCGAEELARVAERGRRIVERVDDRPAEDERPDVVQAVLEGDRDAEVPRPA